MPSASKPPTGYRFAPLRPGTPHFDEAVRRYLAIWPGEAQGIADFFTRYAALPDYQGLVALRADGEGGANGTTVGHGFGVRSLPGTGGTIRWPHRSARSIRRCETPGCW